jgi:hypothetical protein
VKGLKAKCFQISSKNEDWVGPLCPTLPFTFLATAATAAFFGSRPLGPAAEPPLVLVDHLPIPTVMISLEVAVALLAMWEVNALLPSGGLPPQTEKMG